MAAFPEIRSVESHTRATVDSGSPGRAAVLARSRTGTAGCYRAARTQGGAAVRLGPAAARVAATAGMPVEVPKSGVLRPPVAPVRQLQPKAAPALTEAAWNCRATRRRSTWRSY